MRLLAIMSRKLLVTQAPAGLLCLESIIAIAEGYGVVLQRVMCTSSTTRPNGMRRSAAIS